VHGAGTTISVARAYPVPAGELLRGNSPFPQKIVLNIYRCAYNRHNSGGNRPALVEPAWSVVLFSSAAHGNY
jgi:hypothetical protein